MVQGASPRHAHRAACWRPNSNQWCKGVGDRHGLVKVLIRKPDSATSILLLALAPKPRRGPPSADGKLHKALNLQSLNHLHRALRQCLKSLTTILRSLDLLAHGVKHVFSSALLGVLCHSPPAVHQQCQHPLPLQNVSQAERCRKCPRGLSLNVDDFVKPASGKLIVNLHADGIGLQRCI